MRLPLANQYTLALLGILTILACVDDPVHPVVRSSLSSQLTLATSSRSTALSASLDPRATFLFASLAHGMSFARGINDAGLVVGDYGGNNIATVWTEAGGFRTIGRLDGSTGCCSVLMDVNASGDAAGFSHTNEPPHVATMLWSQATNTRLNLQVPRRAYGQSINDDGHVVGTSLELGSTYAAFYRPMGGSAVELRLPLGATGGGALDINAAGAIVGVADPDRVNAHALLWPQWDAAPIDLGTLGGAASHAWELNDAGDIVGWSQATSGERHAFLWTSSSGMIDLNTWPNSCAGSSEAFAINQAGIIVGKCNGRPVLWTATEGMRELPLPSGVTTGEAQAVNGNSTIVGTFNGFGAALWKLANSPPSVSAGGPYVGAEGSPTRFDFSASDPDGDALSYTWDLGDGTRASGQVPPTSHMYADDGSYTVTLTVSDGRGESDTKTTSVAVRNVAPTVGPIAAPLEPQAVGSLISIAASFTDPGTADTHAGQVDWGDGTSSVASIDAATARGTHTYVVPGVYTVTAQVTDDDGGSAEATFQYVVVYDPSAGFVTGGGWIDSPSNACAILCSGASGKANFGFVAKYRRGTETPDGNTEFHFNAGGLTFRSTGYQWLVVAGARAQYKGVGTINGQGSYNFLLTAIDGQLQGGGAVDAFRIKITDPVTGAVVYDNRLGAADDSGDATALGGGSITIHH
jgi:probable HAF family extracellular repeat protein